MAHTPYKAVFFDLDGTILPMDMDAFIQKYLAAVSRFVASSGLDVDLFNQSLNLGIRAMASHDDGRSNAAVFWEAFFAVAPKGHDNWRPLLEVFYENEFGAIGEGIVPNPCAAESVGILRDKGYPLVLATMPMFPLRAAEWRLGWADVDPAAFCRITSFENSTSIKPKLAYYEENLKAGGLKPQEVLMVGNNTRDDLECLKLGMDAYLVTDFLLDPDGFDVSTVKHGSFQDFTDWVKGLPPCTEPAAFETGLISR